MVPKGWQKSQVSDICKLQNGNGFKPHQWDTKGLPIIRIQNLNGSDNFNYYSGEVNDKWLVETGQLLFSWAGTKGVSFGPFVWKRERGVLNQHIYKVFAHENVSYDWLYEALKWVTHKIEAQAHGFKSTLVHVKKQDIDNQSILVPPFSEQQRIAKILSTWDNAISSTEKLIANSKQQKKALMQQLLTGKKRLVNPETGKAFEGEWEEVTLRQLGKCITGLTYSPDDVVEKGTLVLRSSNIQDGKLSFIDNVYVSSRIKEEAVSRVGDILICVRNGSRNLIGKSAYITEKAAGQTHGAFMTSFRGKNPEFVFQLFQTSMFYRQVNMNLGATINSINTSDLHKFKFTIPKNAGEVSKIANTLAAADKEIELLEEKLAHLKQEKKALMQQLLTGKRRVKIAA
ncbi:restriction endonuclease subunit S [Vibrio chagasii]|uniref:restriction endonuclease subunit S n=1 Tax=Vibrio chagasii TaxID=170679 RepID=UPI001EFE1397|nr:restriction endonuclease subunit S [Vibrio chagasii]MCG9569045.1 restriction endonuclease subunit S [Vibrio chagasii]